jgi:hypothetical protein
MSIEMKGETANALLKTALKKVFGEELLLRIVNKRKRQPDQVVLSLYPVMFTTIEGIYGVKSSFRSFILFLFQRLLKYVWRFWGWRCLNTL